MAHHKKQVILFSAVALCLGAALLPLAGQGGPQPVQPTPPQLGTAPTSPSSSSARLVLEPALAIAQGKQPRTTSGLAFKLKLEELTGLGKSSVQGANAWASPNKPTAPKL